MISEETQIVAGFSNPKGFHLQTTVLIFTLLSLFFALQQAAANSIQQPVNTFTAKRLAYIHLLFKSDQFQLLNFRS